MMPDIRERHYGAEQINMHEMSYVIRFVNLAEQTAREENAKRVISITVEVGETSGVLPEYLHKYYPDAVKGTLLEGSDLHVVSVPVEAVCGDCGTHYHPDRSNNYSCPACHSIRAKITDGRGVRLRTVEIDS